MDDRGSLVSFLDGVKALIPVLGPAQCRIQRVRLGRGGRCVKPTIYIRQMPRLKKEWPYTYCALYLDGFHRLTLTFTFILVLRAQLIEFEEQSVKDPLLHQYCGLGYIKIYTVFLREFVGLSCLSVCNTPTEPAVWAVFRLRSY